MAEFGYIWIPTDQGCPPGLGGPTEDHPRHDRRTIRL